MTRWSLLLGSCVALTPLAPEAAAPATAKREAKAEAADDESDPSKRGASATRPGSLLKRDKPVGEKVDLRGELERRRDFEIVRHYTRVAELDVIEEIAHEHDDLALAERVEGIRRKELRRYLAVMQRLRDLARAKALRGTP